MLSYDPIFVMIVMKLILVSDVKGHSENSGKKSSGLGKFLRNLGIRKSGRKNTYKQTSGIFNFTDNLLVIKM